jgi:hypothetical protein
MMTRISKRFNYPKKSSLRSLQSMTTSKMKTKKRMKKWPKRLNSLKLNRKPKIKLMSRNNHQHLSLKTQNHKIYQFESQMLHNLHKLSRHHHNNKAYQRKMKIKI